MRGNVDYSVISSNVTIEAGADVRYSVVMPGAHIKKGAKVYYSIVAENAVIQADAKVGEIPEQLQNPADWGHCRYRCRRYRHRQEGHCTR